MPENEKDIQKNETKDEVVSKPEAEKPEEVIVETEVVSGAERKVIAVETSAVDAENPVAKKRWPWVIGVVAVAVIAVAAIIFFSIQKGGLNPKYADAAAVVNGEVIPMSAYTKQTELYDESIKSYDGAEQAERTDEINQLIMDQLIQQKLAEQLAAKADIKVGQEEVDSTYKMLIDTVGGEEAAKEILEAQGMTVEDYKEQLGVQLLIQGYVEKEFANLTVSDDEVKAYFEENKADYVDEKGKETSLEDATVEIKDILLADKQGDAFNKKLDEFLKSSKVEVFVEGLKVPTSIDSDEPIEDSEE